MCSFLYPKPTLDGREVCAETFEWIRQRLWKIYHYHLLSATLWSPPAWDNAYIQEIEGSHYGYVRGDVVLWNDEYYVCDTIVNAAYEYYEWVADNPRPDEGGWVLGVDERIYCHYAYNSGRYKTSYGAGDPAGREILPAYHWLPEHTVRWNRAQGPLQWTPYTLFWEGDTIQIGSNYYVCTTTHKASAEFSLTNWTSITAGQAAKPIYHPQPVEVKKKHISQVIGARFVFLDYDNHSIPTPHYFGYHMNQNIPAASESASPYINPKMNEAYQDAVELAANSTAWLVSGAMNTDEDAPVHRAGYGVDTSGSYLDHTGWNKNNFAFNKSGFEEFLSIIGSYDWYLDTNFPPERDRDQPQNNSVACWRRCWKYSMMFPYGADETTMWPGEKGNPPEPSTTWQDASAVAAMAASLSSLVSSSERADLIKRHTCQFFSEYAEIPAELMQDMVAVIDEMAYKEVWPSITQKVISRSANTTGYASSLSAAMSEMISAMDAAEWSEYTSDAYINSMSYCTRTWADEFTLQYTAQGTEQYGAFDIGDDITKQLFVHNDKLVLPLEIYGQFISLPPPYDDPETFVAMFTSDYNSMSLESLQDDFGSGLSGNAWTAHRLQMCTIGGMETVERDSVEYTRFKVRDLDSPYKRSCSPPSQPYNIGTGGYNNYTGTGFYFRFLNTYPVGVSADFDELSLGCYAFPATKVIPNSSGLTLP